MQPLPNMAHLWCVHVVMHQNIFSQKQGVVTRRFLRHCGFTTSAYLRFPKKKQNENSFAVTPLPILVNEH